MSLNVEIDVRYVITTNPTDAVLWKVIEAMDSDPISDVSYTDLRLTPTTWLEAIRSGSILPFFWSLNEEVGGAYWLHDMGKDEHGNITHAWTGMYHLNGYRGHKAAAAWQLTLLKIREAGIHSLFGACRISNTRAQAFVEQKMGYSKLGIFPKWMPFQGALDDVILYAIRQEDESLAWQLAASRASEVQRLYQEKVLAV